MKEGNDMNDRLLMDEITLRGIHNLQHLTTFDMLAEVEQDRIDVYST